MKKIFVILFFLIFVLMMSIIIWPYVFFIGFIRGFTTIGFLLLSVYYFFRTNIDKNILKGFLFLALSILIYVVTNYLTKGDVDCYNNIQFLLNIGHIDFPFLRKTIYLFGVFIKIWQLYLLLFILGNWVVTVQKPKWFAYATVNIWALGSTAMLYFIYG